MGGFKIRVLLVATGAGVVTDPGAGFQMRASDSIVAGYVHKFRMTEFIGDTDEGLGIK